MAQVHHHNESKPENPGHDEENSAHSKSHFDSLHCTEVDSAPYARKLSDLQNVEQYRTRVAFLRCCHACSFEGDCPINGTAALTGRNQVIAKGRNVMKEVERVYHFPVQSNQSPWRSLHGVALSRFPTSPSGFASPFLVRSRSAFLGRAIVVASRTGPGLPP